MEKRKDSLTAVKQCRFCLSDEFVELQSLYYRNRQSRNVVTPPMKILASLSVEVFPSDKMPTYICRRCSFFMDICYEFKQVCRQADESIFKFIQCGTALEPVVWPSLLSRTFKNTTKKPSSLKTTVEDGTKVEVTPQYMSESEEDAENVYNVKIEDGTDEESARIKVITGKNDPKKKSRPRNKDDEDNLGESDVGGDNFVEGCWACDECQCTYPLQQLLELHKMQKHRARNHPCDQCDAKFFSAYDLSTHRALHSTEMHFECVACGKKFRRQTLLKRHEKTVHADKPQKACPRCPATFLTHEEMEEHLPIHAKADSLQHPCNDCGKKFWSQTILQRHIVTVHSESDEWACQYCSLRFSTATKLTRHVRSHAGERQYPCKYCNKSFVKSHHYTRHLRVKHQDSGGGTEQYRCEQCEDTFVTQDELIYHSAIHATQNLTCPLCQEKFEDVDAVTAHIKSHVTEEEFMCDYCELVFTCKEKLDMHALAAHEEELQNSMEFEENESSMDMDAEPEAEEDDLGINLKEQDGELLLEINKPEGFMFSNSRHEEEEIGDNTNSEESEAEASYMEVATVDPVSAANLAQMPPLTAAPSYPIVAHAPVAMPPVAPPAVLARPDDQTTVRNASTTQNAVVIRKTEIVKRNVIQQAPREMVQEKKEKPVFKVENNSSTGANDKSLRLLEKELQELKRTTSRNEIPKTPAKAVEPLRSSRRPQPHTSTPKPRTIEDKKQVSAKVAEKKVVEKRSIRENKEVKESKDTRTKDDSRDRDARTKDDSKDTRTKDDGKESRTKDDGKDTRIKDDGKDIRTKDDCKDTRIKDDSKDTRNDDSKVKQEEKEKDLKEPETPKNVVKNGDKDKSTPDEGPVRRSTRPSKVKDYAKMIRDKPQGGSDDDSDDDDEEYVEEDKNESQRSRRVSTRPAVKLTPAKATPPRKRGRPRKGAPKEETEVAPKMRKEEHMEEENKNKMLDESDYIKRKEENVKIPAKNRAAEENDENNASDENGNAGADKTNAENPKNVDTIVSPTGATLKKVGTLPPGIKALPLPKTRAMGPGELCEMQIGKKVVKVQKIVMTKAEVEAMAKKGLVEMKDGTIVLKQGIKLPAKDPVAIKSSLVGEEAGKEAPTKKYKCAPTRCDYEDET